jgi:ribosomal protein S18 acetylase RimI-like enzyme
MLPAEIRIRAGEEGDLAAAGRLQALAPGAAQWSPADYLDYDFRVAICGDGMAGFAVARALGEGEGEVLNLVVEPAWRRRGIAGELLRDLAVRYPSALYLEVRESNAEARAFYQAFGFREIGSRPEYYRSPSEGAVVMVFRSCYCHK